MNDVDLKENWDRVNIHLVSIAILPLPCRATFIISCKYANRQNDLKYLVVTSTML
jgi:hypothetical protein